MRHRLAHSIAGAQVGGAVSATRPRPPPVPRTADSAR
jgi:hypothetical protein